MTIVSAASAASAASASSAAAPGRRGAPPRAMARGSLALALLLAVAACGGEPQAEASGAAASEGAMATTTTPEVADLNRSVAARSAIPLDYAGTIEMRVYASPTCGCCSLWVEHLEENGFEVETVYRDDMAAVKQGFGITDRVASCHTGVVNGYLVEGHVPASDIRALLAEAPGGVRGLAVPGMPVGSPGMEMGDQVDPYDVLRLKDDGTTEVAASYGR